jgi:outer membrane immunogenic protein
VGTGISDYKDSFDINGFTGGVHAGWNFQMDSIVLGVEGDIELSDVDGDNPDWPFGDDSEASVDAQGSLRLRLGFAADNILLYGTGGLAFGDLNAEFHDGPAKDSFSDWETGWTAGGGIEYGFNEQWSMNVEYRYTNFDTLSGVTTNTDPGWIEHHDLIEDAIRVGFSYHM